jgi:hypothetical protein
MHRQMATMPQTVPVEIYTLENQKIGVPQFYVDARSYVAQIANQCYQAIHNTRSYRDETEQGIEQGRGGASRRSVIIIDVEVYTKGLDGCRASSAAASSRSFPKAEEQRVYVIKTIICNRYSATAFMTVSK